MGGGSYPLAGMQSAYSTATPVDWAGIAVITTSTTTQYNKYLSEFNILERASLRRVYHVTEAVQAVKGWLVIAWYLIH